MHTHVCRCTHPGIARGRVVTCNKYLAMSMSCALATGHPHLKASSQLQEVGLSILRAGAQRAHWPEG